MTLGNCGHAAVWLRANISSALSNPASDTSVEGGCDRFLTNDTRLSAFTGIAVEVLP